MDDENKNPDTQPMPLEPPMAARKSKIITPLGNNASQDQATDAPTPTPHVDIASVYPNDPKLHPTKSQSPKATTAPAFYPLPVGVYLIAVWSLLLIALQFLFSSQKLNAPLVAVSIVDALLCLGLLYRWESARRVFLGTQILTILITAIAFGQTIALNKRTNDQREKVGQALSGLTTRANNPEQQRAMIAIQSELDKSETKLHTAYGKLYARFSLSILVSFALILYLMRPNVRRAFTMKPRSPARW